MEKVHTRLGNDIVVGIGVGIGIDQNSLSPGILKHPRPFDPDADTDPDTDQSVVFSGAVR